MQKATLSTTQAETRTLTIEASRAAWLNSGLIFATVFVAAVLMLMLGLQVILFHTIGPWKISVLLFAIAAWYQRRNVPGFSLALTSLAQIVLFSGSYTILMYCCGAIGLPFQDTALNAFDEACGVDIGALVRWTEARPSVKAILIGAYNSMMVQTALLLFALGIRKDAYRLQGFVCLFITTLLVCVLGLALFPAIGPYEFCGYSPSERQQGFITHLHALRDGSMNVLLTESSEGLITCPSFHCIWAIILTWGFWKHRALRWFVGALNAVVVVSTLMLGWHFFADAVAGIAIAFAGIYLWHRYRDALFDSDGSPRMASAHINIREPAKWSLLALAMITTNGNALAANTEPAIDQATGAPDFGQEVWPILATHCVECHNANVNEGGLSLESRTQVLAGGSRGSAVSKHSPDDSPITELIQQDAHPRMPFEREPLSEHQIDVLTRWVRAGAPYGEVSEDAVVRLQRQEDLNNSLETLRSVAFAPIPSPMDISRFVPVWPVTLGMPIVLLVFAWQKRRTGLLPQVTSKPISLGFWMAGTSALFGILLVRHYRDCMNPMTLRGMQHQVHMMFGNPPRPVNLNELPSLNRIYYRGNDERSPKMFNNGNYRTSTFRVDIVDQTGRQLNIGDTVANSQQAFFRWCIERAPYTPDILFDPELMARVFLTTEDDIDAAMHADDRTFLEMESPNQTWMVRFPATGSLTDGHHVQNIYIWHTLPTELGEPLPKLHYAVEIHLDVKDGVVTDTSDVWLGGMRFTQPFLSFKIPSDQWLSPHPIPELPKPNLQSAETLGLDEHVLVTEQ